MTPWRRRAPGPNSSPASTIKRRHERYLLNTRLTATIRGDPGETKIQTHALDVSESGIGTLSHESWGIGVHADLKILLPADGVHLQIRAVVRHLNESRCGLEFVEVSPEQQQILRDACKLLAARRVIPGTDLR